MSREIKFRAWLKEDKKMVNVKTIDFTDKTIRCLKKNEFINAYLLRRVSFDDVELMQYTEVKDKNGKEIYEGDIVKIIKLEGYGEYCDQVEYTGRIECYISEFRIQPLNLRLSDESTVEIEIIRNIYENKNLLEENKWANTR